MAQAVLVDKQAELARMTGEVLADAGLPVEATYWDYDAEHDDWNRWAALSKPMTAADFLSEVVLLRRAGKLDSSLEPGDLRCGGISDLRARALLRLRKVSRRPTIHVKETLIDNCYFDEAILGYVSPEISQTLNAA